MDQSEPIIIARGVEKWYGQFQALKGVDMEVQKGEVIVIFGPSGSGKSTFIRCLNHLEDHQKGQIIIDGIELINSMRNIEKIRMETGMVFQSFNLVPSSDSFTKYHPGTHSSPEMVGRKSEKQSQGTSCPGGNS